MSIRQHVNEYKAKRANPSEQQNITLSPKSHTYQHHVKLSLEKLHLSNGHKFHMYI